ncbi:MAG TPA: response regulator [Thermoanaerobaculia bacterium]
MTTSSSRRLRILWVDDDGPDRFTFERHFLNDECNATVDFAVTVNAARKKLLSFAYDLVILDNYLPADDPLDGAFGNGIKFLVEIREELLGSDRGWPNVDSIPIVMCSALYDEELQRILDMYGVQTLHKPIDEDALKEFVMRVKAREE